MKRILAATAFVLGVVVLLAIAVGVATIYLDRGENLNRRAWEATYIERGEPVPESGPREGYWGRRHRKGTPDNLLGWKHSEMHLTGLLDFDANGYQRYKPSMENPFHIVILGGSVAGGGYASSIRKTYFHVIGSRLERAGLPSEIVVIAAGGWKSMQEINALKLYLENNDPDLVVFLNGLNDITCGATSRSLYGEMTRTKDGSDWTPWYHSHDYEQRVSDYMNNMAVARSLTNSRKIDMLVVLQPALSERARRTSVEEKLLAASLVPHASSRALETSYSATREAMLLWENSGRIRFLDCSRAFDRERHTVFADMWHFSDVGHTLLGTLMAEEISRILGQRDKGREALAGSPSHSVRR